MKTILLIDDEEFCRTPAALMLQREGWEVFEAADGEQGIRMAFEKRPDVILVDLLMPRVNGYQVCRAVRENPDLRNTRLIVMSGRDFGSDRQSAQEVGANDFLVKPVQFEVLKATLAKAPVVPHSSEETAPPVVAPSLKPVDDHTTRVKFWGVRGSIPTPGQSTVFFGGNTACVEVRADGEVVILDAGSGIRPLGEALAAEFGAEPMEINLLVSHTHWDHIQGFPFFLPAYDSRNRVYIHGYEGARDGLAATLAGQMESPYFPIALKQMPGNIVIRELKEMAFKIGSLRVEACFSNHPGVCVGYKVFTAGGTLVYLPDNESFGEQDATTPGGEVPRNIEKNLTEFIQEVDVLIIDAQYSAEEYRTHVGWGHGCVDDVVRFAYRGGVKRLYLFHHDPRHDDRAISGMLMHARELVQELGGAMRVEAAREGEQFVLEPRPIHAM